MLQKESTSQHSAAQPDARQTPPHHAARPMLMYNSLLHPFKPSTRERHSLAPLRPCPRHDAGRVGYDRRLIRNSRPQSDAPRVIQRMSAPRTVGMIAKRRRCVNGRNRLKTVGKSVARLVSDFVASAQRSSSRIASARAPTRRKRAPGQITGIDRTHLAMSSSVGIVSDIVPSLKRP